MKRSILIITYYYAPMLSARAFRWAALAERWASQGHRVDVVAGLEGDLTAFEEINGVSVHRVNAAVFEYAKRRLGRSDAEQTETAAPAATAPSPVSRFLSIASWIYYQIIVKLYWPDFAFLWRGPAIRKAMELARRQAYDVLIGVSPPFTDQLVAEQVYRRAGIPRWVVDFGDPFSVQHIQAHNNAALYRRLNERVERRVLNRTQAISVTTRPTQDLFVEHFPEVANKIVVIPPLLSLDPQIGSRTDREQNSPVTLLFAGTFYAETRPPDFLLKLFAQLLTSPEWQNRLQLHIYGSVSTAREAFERHQDLIDQGHIVVHGLVDRDVVTEAMSRADILVNVGNKTYYQLPSKVIEYTATGKPILNIIQIEDDSSKVAYANYPAVLNLLDAGGSEFSNQLETLHNWIANLPDPVDPAVLDSLLVEYRLDAVGRAYDDLIGL